MSKGILDKILNEVSLDSRVHDGVFKIEEDSHMEALREYLVKRGFDEASAIEFSNRVLEGKYPERQAYNAKGILVTFPTPEYKQDAIKRGTHFEKDPTKGMSNLFQDKPASKSPEPSAPPPKPAEGPKAKPSEPKTNLPVSQASPPDSDDTPAADVQAQTTAAPQQVPIAPEAPPEAVEPTELPPVPIKSPAEREANRKVVKQIMKGDDYMLERFAAFIAENIDRLPGDMKELIVNRIRI